MVRSKNSFKESFICVQSHLGSSKCLEMRAIWSWLVNFEIYEIDREIFLCHVSCIAPACLNMDKLTKTPLVAEKKVLGLLAQFTKTYFCKEFWGQDDVKDNLQLQVEQLQVGESKRLFLLNYSWYSKSESCSRWGTAWRLFLLLWFVRNEKSKQLRRCDQNCEGFSPSTEKMFFDSQSNEHFRYGNSIAI